MSGSGKRGFTLAELMVVVLVIGILAAMVMPYFQRVFAVQRRTVCCGNLEKIGQAYGSHIAQRKVSGHTGTGLTGQEWQRTLLGEVSEDKQVFYCPEDEEHELGQKASLAQYYMDVFRGGNYDGSVSLDEDESSEWVWKLSETQFNTFKDAVARYGRQNKPYKHPGYLPDDNPELYYFSFEDMAWTGNADKDFWDLMFRIETVNGMDLKVSVVHGATGYTHDLYLGAPGTPDRKLLFKNCKQHVGEFIIVKGEDASSYGLNSVAQHILPGSKRSLLVMDYEVLQVAGSRYDETRQRRDQLNELWVGDPNHADNTPSFARHLGRCNVLFADGSVRGMSPAEIHPENDEAWKYWDP